MCVIFHLFQLSKMNNESFVEKLKKIAREKKEARRSILHEWEKITTWRSGCYGRQNVERRTSSLSIFFSKLWPSKVNWRKVTSFNEDRDWSSKVAMFVLGTCNFFFSSWTKNGGAIKNFRMIFPKIETINIANTIFIYNSFCTTFCTKFLEP